MALVCKGILQRSAVIVVLGIVVLLIGTSAASAASARPDLVSNAPSLTPNRVTAGGTVTAASTIRNTGRRTAAKSITIFYISVDAKLDKTDILIGGFKTPKLKPGRGKRGSFKFTVPVDFPPLTYRILSCADGVKGLREKLEKNNCKPSFLSILKPTGGTVTPNPNPNPGPTEPVGPDPNDGDGDGVSNVTDNCPAASNPGQEDSDADGKGDVCDPCPNDANPGVQGCPVTVYSIKNGTTTTGTAVHVVGVVVTAVKGSRIWAQVPTGDPNYVGRQNSGIEIDFSIAPAISVGDKIDVDGSVVAGKTISATNFSVTATGQALPAPLLITAADLAGAYSSYDAVLIEIDTATFVSTYATNNWLLNDGQDFAVFATIYGTLPANAASYDSITGIAADDGTKRGLMPRTAADIVESP